MINPIVWNRMRRVAFFFLLLIGSAYPQARNCDFYGTAKYRGVKVTSSDQVKAYDTGGQLCGTAYYVGGSEGNYAVHVAGDDPATTDVDEGAPEGTAITFRINNEVANVTGGSSTWTYNGSWSCNIEVPDLPPNAAPGGPYSGAEGSAIQFNGSGSTGGATYAWTFGDGGTSSEINPTHAYGDNGTYTVTLTVTNNSAVSDMKSTSAAVSNVAPTVSASSNAPKNETETVTFTGSATDPAGANDPLTYSWDFGDGGTSNQQNPTHAYADNGTYNVTLSVWDGNDTGTKQISVVINNVPPTVSASSNAPKNEGAAVQFTGSATDPAGAADPLTYSWTFGDGGTSTAQNPTHAYADNGTYNVTLSVWDGDDTGIKQISVVINNVAPTPNAGGPYYGVVNYPVQFSGSATDPGSADVLTYTWDLDNDGSYDDFTGPSPTKTWTAVGNYPVSLKVTDDDGGSNTSSTSVDVGLGIPVTFKTQPAGLKVRVDGELVTTPKTYYYPNGSQHQVEAPYSQGEGGGQRYVWSNWSNGQQMTFTLTVGVTPLDITANYRLQYFLDINDGGKGSHYTGEDWYNAGAQATITVDATVTDPAGTTRYLFNRWAGTGDGSYSGAQINAQVTMNAPVTETVQWGAGEYYLKVQSPYGTAHGEGWYAAGASVPVSVDTAISTGPGRRQKFLSWTGQGAGSFTGSGNPASVTMNAPIVETAVWRVEYYLDLRSDFGTPSGRGWYVEGSTAVIKCDTTSALEDGKRMRFTQWTGVGTGSYTGPQPEHSFAVSGPVTETAQWKTQYRLSLVSAYGTPKGQGWYDDGTRVTFWIDTLSAINATSRHRFTGWTGTGATAYSGSDWRAEVVLTAKAVETASWRTEYFVTLAVDPAGSGSVSPLPAGGGWAAAGDTLELRAIGRLDLGYGFSNWTGDTTGNANPLRFPLKRAKSIVAHFRQGNVFIATEPSGLLVKIDGKSSVSPAVLFDWLPGEHHQIGADSLQGADLTVRYAFVGWSDGLSRNHEITVTGTAQRITARFDQYCYVNVVSDYGRPAGQGWYKKGATAGVGVDTVANVTADTRLRFKGWTGTGSGSVTSAAPAIQIPVQGPITERAQWEPQVKVTTTVFPPAVAGGSITATPSLAWYPIGSTVSFRAVAGHPDHPFVSWGGAASGNANPVVLTVSKPMNVIGRFWIPDDPPVIHSIPEFVLREDETKVLGFAWLGQYITDPNDAIETLVLTFGGAADVRFIPDFEKQTLTVAPLPHWNGVETAMITVTDPYGLSDTSTVSIKVLSVEDPPQPFDLVYPTDGMTLSIWITPLKFLWHRSEDPDHGDAVQYSLMWSPSPQLKGDGTLKMSLVADTTLYLSPQKDGTYYWGVIAQDLNGNTTLCRNVFRFVVDKTGIETKPGGLPLAFGLDQNYPNPFNPVTAIPFQMPKPGDVTLRVYDLYGRLVRVLAEGPAAAGFHEVRWDGKDSNGSSAASGVYVVQIRCGSFVEQRKMILMR
jgi:PKD repeat protein